MICMHWLSFPSLQCSQLISFLNYYKMGCGNWPIWGPTIDASENVFTPGRDSQRRGSAKSSTLLVSESMCGRFSLGFDKSFEGAFEWCRFFFVLCQTTFTLSLSDRFHYIAQNMTSKPQPTWMRRKGLPLDNQMVGGWVVPLSKLITRQHTNGSPHNRGRSCSSRQRLEKRGELDRLL